VVIEDNVWIGYNATILKGVRVGEGRSSNRGSGPARCPLLARVMGNPHGLHSDEPHEPSSYIP